jgi:hypothetical protein
MDQDVPSPALEAELTSWWLQAFEALLGEEA